jgi:UDP-N-acetylmuramate dehydrogenase
MQSRNEADLTQYNTLKLQSKCQLLFRINRQEDIPQAIALAKEQGVPWFVLGGGSNVVLSEYYAGAILHMHIRGIKRELVGQAGNADNGTSDLASRAEYTVGAGENWNLFVRQSLCEGYGGLENLSLIPGTVGAAPIQNIGAYGVEVAQHITGVTVYDTLSQSFTLLKPQDCDFGYRSSIFKRHPDRYVVCNVRFSLSKDAPYQLSYAGLAEKCDASIAGNHVNIGKVISNIRKLKLPDPAVLPNAGSFFKNPVISFTQFNSLKKQYPSVAHYPEKNAVKVAAGWLIEQAGWKGFRNEKVGIHTEQALVVVNHNGGNAADILHLAEQVRHAVLEKFSISLEIEPVVLR